MADEPQRAASRLRCGVSRPAPVPGAGVSRKSMPGGAASLPAVHAPGAVTVGVRRHEREACIMDAFRQITLAERVHEAFAQLRGDFDTSKVAMGATTHLAEARIDQRILGLLHGCEVFGRDGAVAGNATRKACIGRFVPSWKAERARKLAHIRLRQAAFQQGAFHGEFLEGFKARAVVAQIAYIGSLGDIGEAELCSFFHNGGEQRRLADVAALGRVFREAVDGQRIDIDDDVPYPVFAAEGGGLRNLARWDHLGIRGDGENAITKGSCRRVQKQRRVDAAGESYGNALERAKIFLQGIVLCGEVCVDRGMGCLVMHGCSYRILRYRSIWS